MLLVCGFLFVVASSILPSLGADVFASPDETAVAFVIKAFSRGEIPRVGESLAQAYPWLHSRSWVSQGSFLLPVGFLGWPLLLSPLGVLGSWILPWAGFALLVSSLYPLFSLFRRRFTLWGAWFGVVLAFASPAVVLYANRGLFPNVGILAGFIWSVWLIHRWSETGRGGWWAGILVGAVLTIRPIEGLWMIPWWGWVFGNMPRDRRKEGWKPVLGCLVALLPFFLINHLTYGSWWNIGYWLKDNPVMNTKNVLVQDNRFSFLPFGIHPRHIWWNLQAFTQEFLWPAVVICLTALGILLYRLRLSTRELHANQGARVLFLSVWTIGSLLLIYGSGLYQDHVQAGAITVANSFLRYLLPLTLVTGLAGAWLFDEYVRDTKIEWVGWAVLLVYVGFGVFSATLKDDEGVWTTRRELKRYGEMREDVQKLLPQGTVLLSERSDKIFVPLFGLRAVSPLPSLEEAARLTKQGESVALYVRPLSQRQRDAWREVGVEVRELASFGRERLYHIYPRQ